MQENLATPLNLRSESRPVKYSYFDVLPFESWDGLHVCSKARPEQIAFRNDYHVGVNTSPRISETVLGKLQPSEL